jgi:hypothetical protein
MWPKVDYSNRRGCLEYEADVTLSTPVLGKDKASDKPTSCEDGGLI